MCSRASTSATAKWLYPSLLTHPKKSMVLNSSDLMSADRRSCFPSLARRWSGGEELLARPLSLLNMVYVSLSFRALSTALSTGTGWILGHNNSGGREMRSLYQSVENGLDALYDVYDTVTGRGPAPLLQPCPDAETRFCTDGAPDTQQPTHGSTFQCTPNRPHSLF